MPDPMYRQIAEDLRQKIKSGDLRPGAQLPTELELREQYDASRNTVRDAVKLLISLGLVETRPGQGTFLVEKIDPFVTTYNPESGFGGTEGAAYASEVLERRRRPDTTKPRVEIQQATGVIATELQLAEGSAVVSRHQQRFVDGTAWSMQTSFYPMSLVERGAVDLIRAVDMPHGVVLYLEEVLGIKQVGLRDKITVRTPDATESAFFKLPGDGRVVMFEVLQTGFDETRGAFRLTVSVYPTDRNQFVVDRGEVPTDAGGASAHGTKPGNTS